MPFNVRKREERRAYYLNRIDTDQNLANQYYHVNRKTVITQTKLRNRTLSRINPSKVKIQDSMYLTIGPDILNLPQPPQGKLFLSR